MSDTASRASAAPVTTVLGPVPADGLGPTLMHEHLTVGFPGWRSDPRATVPDRADVLAMAKDRVAEMTSAGITAMVDPCPIDLGRDPLLAAEVADATGLHIVMATGLYLDAMAASHWKYAASFEGARYLADTFIHELTEGIEGTDVKAGIIKVATGPKRITRYERLVLEAAAIASVETGTGITTHTDRGQLGDEQQRILVEHGVAPERIIVGHSCASTDPAYHRTIAGGGSYLGFDRFGLESEIPDATRTESLWHLLEDGFGDRIVVSQDTTWCWYGKPASWADEPTWHVLRFVRDIAPALRDLGATAAQIDALLTDNPRNYFGGVPLAAPGPRVPVESARS